MNWIDEPEEDRELVDRGAILFQRATLAAVLCAFGFIAALIGVAT